MTTIHIRKHLESAIAALRGTDKRTINKWLAILEMQNKINKFRNLLTNLGNVLNMQLIATPIEAIFVMGT
jgi:hypothetical protein